MGQTGFFVVVQILISRVNCAYPAVSARANAAMDGKAKKK